MKSKLRLLIFFATFLLILSITSPIFAAENLVNDPSFEDQDGGVSEPWRIQDHEDDSGIDTGDRALTGDKNVWLRVANGWNSVRQYVDVKQNTDYILTANVKVGTDIKEIFFGVWPDGADQGKEQVFNTEEFEAADDYNELTFEFNSEDVEQVDIYLGTVQSEGGENWLNVDDFSLVEVAAANDDDAAASDDDAAIDEEEDNILPNTSTPFYNSLFAGFALIVLGGIVMFFFRRKKVVQ